MLLSAQTISLRTLVPPRLVYSRTSCPRVRSMSIGISIYMFSPVLVRWRRQPTWQIKAHILSSRDMFLLND